MYASTAAWCSNVRVSSRCVCVFLARATSRVASRRAAASRVCAFVTARLAASRPRCAASRSVFAFPIDCSNCRPEFVGSVNAGISGGGPGIVVVVVGPGTVLVVGSEGVGMRGPPTVVDVVGAVGVGAFAVVVVVGASPYAIPGAATDASMPAATAATTRTRAREVPNIPTHVGIRARNLQECPGKAHTRNRAPPVPRGRTVSFWAPDSTGDPCRPAARPADRARARRGCSS